MQHGAAWTIGSSYDAIGRMSGLAQHFAGGTGNMAESFAYNPASQLTSATRSNADYGWTGHVNVDRPYAANGLNQYTAAGAASFTYDANGNLTSDGSTSFTYDMENRLVAASGAKGANLRYDPLGRLYEVNGPFGLTRFIYDGDHVAAEYNSAGTVLRRYMWGPGADEPILWDEGSAVNCSGGKFLHPDRQGSVVAAADCAGALIGINKYDEYGIPQSGNIGRFQYTGQAWLPELGMYYYKARIYSPTLGRFMQTDPIGYDDQFNLYAYVANDPVNKSDPDGMQTVMENWFDANASAYVGDDIDENTYRERQAAARTGGEIGSFANPGSLPVRGGISVARALATGGMAGLRVALGMGARLTIPNAQLGMKFAQHFKEWGLSTGRSGVQRFASIIGDIGRNPDRLVRGTFSGGGEGGRRAVNFHIKGNDVVVATRQGEFITILKGEISNSNVQSALKISCTGTRIVQTSC